MSTNLPSPLVEATVDLKDFPFTPIFRSRLFGSAFHAISSDSEWRAGVTLWMKSWDQAPAGTLPDDDVVLCRLAELGRDLKAWMKIRANALHGWFKCSDGRLHHKVVAEGVNDAWKRKSAQRARTAAARSERQMARDAAKRSVTESVTGSVTDSVTEDFTCLEASVTDTVTGSVTASKGQGQLKEEREEGSVSALRSETAASPLDLKRELWERGKAFLVNKYGKTKHEAGELIGKWCKLHSHSEVLDALAKAEAASPGGDIVAFVEGIFRKGRPKTADPAEMAATRELDAEMIWEVILKGYLRDGAKHWPDTKGVPPGLPGCQVPRHLLDRHAAEFRELGVTV